MFDIIATSLMFIFAVFVIPLDHLKTITIYLFLQAIPIILITAIGFSLELLAILRLAATRDDVWYTNGSAACEFIETRRGYQVPIRKVSIAS